MDHLFRFLSVVAIALSAVAISGTSNPEPTDSSEPSGELLALKQNQQRLEEEVKSLRSQLRDKGGVGASEMSGNSNTPSMKFDFDNPEHVARLSEMIDSKVEEQVKPVVAAAESRLNAKLGSVDSPTFVSEMNMKKLTLKEAGKEIGLTDFDIEFIEEQREKGVKEFAEIMLDEGETVEDLKELMANVETDDEARAKMTQKFVTKAMMGGGLAKLMAIRTKSDAALKERFGDAKYKKYKAIEPRIEHTDGFNFQMNMGARRR